MILEKGLMFFTLAVACLWVILDDLFGDKRLSKVLENLTPDLKTPVETFIEGSATMEEKMQDQKDAKKWIDEQNVSDSYKDKSKKIIDKFYLDNGVIQES